jgi:acyl-ACP thioesterase
MSASNGMRHRVISMDLVNMHQPVESNERFDMKRKYSSFGNFICDRRFRYYHVLLLHFH